MKIKILILNFKKPLQKHESQGFIHSYSKPFITISFSRKINLLISYKFPQLTTKETNDFYWLHAILYCMAYINKSRLVKNSYWMWFSLKINRPLVTSLFYLLRSSLVLCPSLSPKSLLHLSCSTYELFKTKKKNLYRGDLRNTCWTLCIHFSILSSFDAWLKITTCDAIWEPTTWTRL